ncbi:MAG: hypothetical protein N2689_18795, partial [Verrucomicrobiae bacterium]|nr:hypothetical protein [Verrucomicrobiae bacterium]
QHLVAYTHDPLFAHHNLPGRPENAGRLDHIMAELSRQGLLERMAFIPARPAGCDLLARVHDAGYVRELAAFADRGGGYLDADTYVRP